MRNPTVLPLIRFFYHSSLSPWRLNKASSHKAWLSECMHHLKKDVYLFRLYYYFITQKKIQLLHKRFLGVDAPTDVLAFDYSNGGRIEGEVFISPKQVRLHAGWYNVAFPKELRRVMVHGLLHLLGWNDKEEREREEMRKREDFCLQLWEARYVSHETCG
ncbi:MAG: rRNA maturation RNase YbeY [Bacteroidia bacterium]|nr:rRNA maturation RNase YbeY [Bacteroidia bacterium]MDW8134325.1 rRNA maturation RNase YbeY [Bacteroidia bacterium]